MHLRPLRQEDVPTYARVASLAMWHDEAFAYVAPRKDQYPESWYHLQLRQAKRRWYDGNFMFLCVSDLDDEDWTGEEEVMGCCAYFTNTPDAQKPNPGGLLGNNFEQWAASLQRQYAHWFGLDRCVDWTAYHHFARIVEDETTFKDYFATLPSTSTLKPMLREDGQPSRWEIGLLATHPDFRRRGVGKLMLEWGFKRAREDMVPLVLLATTAGRKLYMKTGFREVGSVRLVPEDLEDNKHNSRTRARLQAMDLGMGVGNGLVCSAMTWEPSDKKP